MICYTWCMNKQVMVDNITAVLRKARLSKDVTTLIARIVIGIVFIVHGVLKWRIGPKVIAGFLGMIHVPLPGVMSWVLIAVEIFAGLAIMLGIYIRPAARLLVLILLIAIVAVKLPIGLVGGAMQGPGYELDLGLLTTLLLLLQTGPGKYSLIAFLPKTS